MSSTTTSKKFVRMFDGAEWATYKVGGKKHRAAEARRAEFDARMNDRKALNGEIATFLRSKGVTPRGRAWDEVKAGTTEAADLLLLTDKNLERLRKLNAKDGLKAPKAGKPEAGEGEQAKPATAERTEPKAAKSSKRRSKAARKAYRARVAAGNVNRVNGRFVAADAVAEEAPAKPAKKGRKQFWADLSDTGLSEAQIQAAWEMRNA